MALTVTADLPGIATGSPSYAKRFYPGTIYPFGTEITDESDMGTWLDPTQTTLMLRPTRFDGDLTGRLRKNQFTFETDGATGAHWLEINDKPTGSDYWLLSDGTDETVTTNTTWDVNQAFWVGFEVYGESNYTFDVLQVWFGQYRLDIKSNGKLVLLNADTSAIVAEGYITRDGRGITRRRIDLMILPYRRRRILFWTSEGWCVYENPDLDETINDWTGMPNEITAAATASFRAPSGKAYVQLMPVYYYTSGEWVTQTVAASYAPTAEQTPETDYDATINAGTGLAIVVKQVDGETNFVADGETTGYTLRFGFTGDGTATPFLYGVSVGWDAVAGEPLAWPTDITDDILSMELEVGEELRDRRLSVRLRNPENYTITKHAGSMIRVQNDGVEIFRGIITDPRIERSPNLNTDIGEFSAQDFYYVRAQQAGFLDFEVDLAGSSHVDAMEYLAQYAGVLDSEMEFDTDTTALPANPQSQATGRQKQAWCTQEADTVYQWMNKVNEDFAANWILDTHPNGTVYSLRYRDRKGLETTPTLTMYPDQTVGPELWYQWLRALTESRMPPEANEVIIMFCDGTGVRKAVRVYDPDSQDCNKLPHERPDNWLGARVVMAADFEDIKDQETARYYAKQAAQNVFAPLDLATWEGEWRGVWPQDVVRLTGYGDYRVTHIKVRFELDADPHIYWPCEYEGVKIADAT